MDIIKTELNEVKEKYGDEDALLLNMVHQNFRIEDMIPDEEVVNYYFSFRIY